MSDVLKFLTIVQLVKVNSCETRMHFSRMRTARLNGHGVCLEGGVCPGFGVCVYTPLTQRQTHTPEPRGRQSPPENRMTDRCKNNTFPQFRLRAVKIKRRHCGKLSFQYSRALTLLFSFVDHFYFKKYPTIRSIRAREEIVLILPG